MEFTTLGDIHTSPGAVQLSLHTTVRISIPIGNVLRLMLKKCRLTGRAMCGDQMMLGVKGRSGGDAA